MLSGRLRAPVRLAPSTRLAGNDGGSEGTFGTVISGLRAVVGEEGEEAAPLLAQPFGEPAIVRIGETARRAAPI